MFENQNNDQFSVSGVETVTGKSKGKKAAVIGGVAAAALVGGCASAYAFSDTVQNQVKLRTMKPEKYFAWVCENNGTDIAKKASTNYEKAVKKIENGTGINYNISYEMSDALKSQLKELTGGDEELTSIIDNIKTVKIDMDGAMGEKGISYSLGAFLNDDKLATVDYTIDTETMDVAVRCPELTEKWLKVKTESITEEISYDDSAQKMLDFYKDFLGDPESVISAQQVEDEINKYVSVWNNTTKDVKIEKKETIDIGDIQVNYTVAEVPVTADMAKEMGTNFINELKNDEVAKSIIVDRLGVSADDFASDLEDALTEISESEGGDDTVTFKSYIDPTGQIRGISVSDGDNEVKAIIGKDGDQIRGEFKANDDVTAVLTATEDSGKSYTGKLEVTADEETVTFDFDSFKVVNEEDGYFEGNVKANIPDSDPLTITFTSDGKSQDITFDIVVDGTDYAKLNLGYAVKNGEKVDIPDESNALVIDDKSMDSLKPEDYVSQSEVETFVTDILTKVGLKDASEIAKGLADNIYNGGTSYSYDSSDFDDYDFDEEDYTFDEDDFNWDDYDFGDDYDFDFDAEDFDITIPEDTNA